MKRRARHQAVQTEADWADEGFRLIGERMPVIEAERVIHNADESIRQARLAFESKQAAGDIAAAFKGEQAREVGEALPSSCDAWLSRPVGEIGGGQ